MMLRKVELGMDLQMAVETGGGILAGVEDEHAAPAAGRNVLAAGAVAGLATALSGHRQVAHMQARMGAGREYFDIILMAIEAGLVAGEAGAFDQGRADDGAHRAGTGHQYDRCDGDGGEHGETDQARTRVHRREAGELREGSQDAGGRKALWWAQTS